MVAAMEAVVMTSIPDFVQREVRALRCDGCQQVVVDHFDREHSIWTVTFEQHGNRRARLLWCVEVDA